MPAVLGLPQRCPSARSAASVGGILFPPLTPPQSANSRMSTCGDPQLADGEQIRARGLVQGVGFRPTVWRICRELGLRGDVRNDGDGVLIRVQGPAQMRDALCARLRAECPPLARIHGLERGALVGVEALGPFAIVASAATAVQTAVVPDAATCPACAQEVQDPANRRYRYPFTNCTHCGPRLSILRAIPYDRANTSMAPFALCADCAGEYADPADRRFHAQPNACAVCGPRLWLEDGAGQAIDPAGLGAADAIAAAGLLLRQGRIIAIKGIGGFHLACDAACAEAVVELRRRKRRDVKPFALMARDPEVVRRCCRLAEAEAELLATAAAPIVLLDRHPGADALVADAVAPGQDSLGCMLPYSPLHLLLLADWERPLVMTSGNLSDEPQCTDNAEAVERLAGLADAWLIHDRAIVNRVDDSVARIIDGEPRLLRRARGYAPAPLPLPPGLDAAPPVLALGAELKSTICLAQHGQLILSQHLGDLEDARTARAFEAAVDLYRQLFELAPQAIAVDLHPDYRSSQRGRVLADAAGIPVVAVQHHFAHIAAVLADNAWPLDAGPVLGVALDGLGAGTDGRVWGGELLIADYRDFRRVGHLREVRLPGGARAIREPWRNLVAQLEAAFGWDEVARRWPCLALTGRWSQRPIGLLRRMIAGGVNAPLSSSCGRLFDAVAAALDICADAIAYEGQAAVELEAAARRGLDAAAVGYPFAVAREPDAGVWLLDPATMWAALLDDLAAGVETECIAARFHLGLAVAVADLAVRIATEHGLSAVALSGGVFQNRTLFEAVVGRLRGHGVTVLTHRRVPANDGGIALGQAVVAACRMLAGGRGIG